MRAGEGTSPKPESSSDERISGSESAENARVPERGDDPKKAPRSESKPAAVPPSKSAELRTEGSAVALPGTAHRPRTGSGNVPVFGASKPRVTAKVDLADLDALMNPEPPAPPPIEAKPEEPPPPIGEADPKAARKKKALDLDDGLDLDAGPGDEPPRANPPGRATPVAPRGASPDASFAAELAATKEPEAEVAVEEANPANNEPTAPAPRAEALVDGLDASDLKPPFFLVYRRHIIGFGGLAALFAVGLVTSYWLNMGWFFSKSIEATVDQSIQDNSDLRGGAESLVRKVKAESAQDVIDRGTYESFRSAIAALTGQPSSKPTLVKVLGLAHLIYGDAFPRKDFTAKLAELPLEAAGADAAKARAIAALFDGDGEAATQALAPIQPSFATDKEGLVILALAEVQTTTVGRALETIDRALVIDSKYPFAWMSAGRLLRRSDPALSAELFAKAVFSEPRFATAATVAADLYGTLGRPGDRLKMLAAAADGSREGLPPDRRGAVNFEAAIAFEDAARPAQMARFAGEAYELEPRRTESLLLLARAHAEMGAGDLAEKVVGRAMTGPARSAADVPALTARAEARFAQNELAKAFTDIDAAKALAPKVALPFFVEGKLNLKLGKLSAAKNAFAAAAAKEGTSLDKLRAQIWRIRTELDLGEIEGAREAAGKLVAADPSDVNALLILGECQRRRGELSSARKTFLTARDLDPEDHRSRLGLAATLRDLAANHPKPRARPEFYEAEAICIDLQRTVSNSQEVLSECGRVLEVAGRTEAALDVYREAAAIDGNSPKPYIAMAGALMSQKEPESGRARAMLDEAIKRAPNDPDIQYWLGRIELLDGSPEKAREAFENAVKGTRTRAEFHLWLGRALKKQDRMLEAVSEWEQALAQNINDIASIRELALAARDQNAFGRAMSLLERYKKALPEDQTIWRDIGETLQMMGKDAESLSAWKKVLDAFPGDPTALLRIGGIEARRSNSTEAVSYFERALTESEDNTATQGEAVCLVALARTKDRKVMLEKCVKHPKAPEDLASSAKKALETH